MYNSEVFLDFNVSILIFCILMKNKTKHSKAKQWFKVSLLLSKTLGYFLKQFY